MTRSGTSTVRELTVRSVVLGGLITLVFTAANVNLLAIVGEGFENWAVALGIVLYVATVAALYRVIRRSGDDQRA